MATEVSLWRSLVRFRVDSTTIDETVPLPQTKNLYRFERRINSVVRKFRLHKILKLYPGCTRQKKEKEKLNFFFPTRSFFYSCCRSSIDRYRSQRGRCFQTAAAGLAWFSHNTGLVLMQSKTFYSSLPFSWSFPFLSSLLFPIFFQEQLFLLISFYATILSRFIESFYSSIYLSFLHIYTYYYYYFRLGKISKNRARA